MTKILPLPARSLIALTLLLAILLAPIQYGLAQGATVSLSPANGSVDLGHTIKVSIRLDNVSDLYGAEVHLTFDPTLLEVVDTDDQAAGVQIAAGTFLAADFVAQNAADNTAGKIDFAISQMPPHDPVTGSGTLAEITFQGKGVGTSDIAFTAVLLSDQDGNSLGAGSQDGTLSVNSTATETPATTPTATPSPTAVPTTPPPTTVPTPTPSTPPPTATPLPSGDILGYHIVQSGETLYCIGRAYGVDPYAIATVNGILNPNVIYAGVRLAIPNAPAPLPAGPVCPAQFDPGRTCQAYHTVATGENLYRIALRYGVSMWAIAEANNILNLNYIRAGDVLCIP